MSARRLLDRAYRLADQNNIEEAKHVLNAIVFNYPNNVEAWEFYLQLCTDKRELDWMVARVSESKRISSNTKTEVVNYYQFLCRSVSPNRFAVLKFVKDMWNKFHPSLKLAIPLFALIILLWQKQILRSLFSIVIAVELIIFILAWNDKREISPLSNIRKFAQESKFSIKRKKDKTKKK